MQCNECNDGIITEVFADGWIKNKCGCKSPEYWQQRNKQKAADRAARIRAFEKKAVV